MSQLNKQELHNLAMNIVGAKLEKDNYDFLAVNSDMKKNPQFIVKKKDGGQLTFVLVKAVVYPEDPDKYDRIWLETFKVHAMSKNALVVYAGVGLANSTDMDKPLTTEDPYIVKFNGLKFI